MTSSFLPNGSSRFERSAARVVQWDTPPKKDIRRKKDKASGKKVEFKQQQCPLKGLNMYVAALLVNFMNQNWSKPSLKGEVRF